MQLAAPMGSPSATPVRLLTPRTHPPHDAGVQVVQFDAVPHLESLHELSAGRLFVVDVYTQWCGPCKVGGCWCAGCAVCMGAWGRLARVWDTACTGRPRASAARASVCAWVNEHGVAHGQMGVVACSLSVL